MSLKLPTLIASLLSVLTFAKAEIDTYPYYDLPSENALYQNYVATPMKRQDYGVAGGDGSGALLGAVALVSCVIYPIMDKLEDMDIQ